MFQLEFATDNAAFDGNREAECAAVLRRIADRIEAGGVPTGSLTKVYDTNGNHIGGLLMMIDETETDGFSA